MRVIKWLVHLLGGQTLDEIVLREAEMRRGYEQKLAFARKISSDAAPNILTYLEIVELPHDAIVWLETRNLPLMPCCVQDMRPHLVNGMMDECVFFDASYEPVRTLGRKWRLWSGRRPTVEECAMREWE